MGAKKVLVVRETRTESSEEVISDKVFGTDGDTVHLSSQYSACSYDQLTFSKYEGNSKVKNGVLTVSVSENPSGSDNGVIRNAMINAASSTLGTNNLSSLADYVMLCIPPGTNGGWIAYAYINFWLSGKNNELYSIVFNLVFFVISSYSEFLSQSTTINGATFPRGRCMNLVSALYV